jgi:hypothetical protein
MGPVEHGPGPIEDDAHARSASLLDLGAQPDQHPLDIVPFDIGPDRVGKDCVDGSLMLRSQFNDHGITL